MTSSVGQQFSDLVDLLAKLRGPNGCPWDSEQTHSSLKRYLLEESYEVLEAIDRDDPKRLKEELGDILLQVLFHAQIGGEDHEFTMGDVLESLRDKLVRRHPHVFGDISIQDARDVEVVWERLKQDEDRADRHESLLGDVPVETPALAYSQLIQDRASRSGFDWQSTDGVLEKVAEEAGEFRAPGGRGHGDPIRLAFELDDKDDIIAGFTADPDRRRLMVSSDGTGFIVSEADLISTTRKGKQIVNVSGPTEVVLSVEVGEGDSVAIVGENRKLLVFPLAQVAQMARGKGVRLQRYKDGGVSDAKVFKMADGLGWVDAAGRVFNRSEAELLEWRGDRAQAGRLVPKGFPKSNKFTG